MRMTDNFERGAANLLAGILKGHQYRQQIQMQNRQQGERERAQAEHENMLRQQFELDKQREGRMAEEESRLGGQRFDKYVQGQVEEQGARLAAGPIARAEQLNAEMAREFAPPQPQKMGEEEKMGLEHKYRMEEIGARGTGQGGGARAKAPKSEQDYIVEQVKDWRSIGSVGPYGTKVIDEANPSLLGRAARYKWAKEQGGQPVTDDEALAVNMAIDHLDTLQKNIATAAPDDEMRMIYNEVQTQTGGDFTTPLWKGKTLKALVPMFTSFDDEEVVDLEDVACETALLGMDLNQVLMAIFGPEVQRRGTETQERNKAATIVEANKPPRIPWGP